MEFCNEQAVLNILFNVDKLSYNYDNIVKWWTEVHLSNRCPVLSKVVVGALSIFHGTRVESPSMLWGM